MAARGAVDEVYSLAAVMDGIGYITASHADLAQRYLYQHSHVEASRVSGVSRFVFSSSACVYAQGKQKNPDVTPLGEEEACNDLTQSRAGSTQ